jgi:hypothetical protein
MSQQPAPTDEHIDRNLAAGEPNNPAAHALAQHIADHPISTIQAAFRELGMRLTFELHEEPTCPHGLLPENDSPVRRCVIRERHVLHRTARGESWFTPGGEE